MNQHVALLLNLGILKKLFAGFGGSCPPCPLPLLATALYPCHYAPHSHVITGDFQIIIPNEDLKQLLLKGPNYREQTSISWGYTIKLIFTATEDNAKKWAKRKTRT